VLDNRRRCVQAAYSDDHCYFHSKLARGLTRRWKPEPLAAPAPRKKAK
jgi:hypothetical protein